MHANIQVSASVWLRRAIARSFYGAVRGRRARRLRTLWGRRKRSADRSHRSEGDERSKVNAARVTFASHLFLGFKDVHRRGDRDNRVTVLQALRVQKSVWTSNYPSSTTAPCKAHSVRCFWLLSAISAETRAQTRACSRPPSPKAHDGLTFEGPHKNSTVSFPSHGPALLGL